MKRSEMLDQIEYLLKYGAYIGLEFNFRSQAEAILDRIEEKGMLPPLNENNYNEMDSDAKIANNLAKNFYRTWEDEK